VEYTPYDAGLDRFVHLDKGEFIGRTAALEASQRPPDWSYGIWTVDIGPLPGEPGDAPPSATICFDGRPAGYVTSAGPGFRTGTRVCLGYVERQFAAADTGFTIDVFGTPMPGSPPPPGRLRPRPPPAPQLIFSWAIVVQYGPLVV